jgi:hypothetical protein
MTEFREADYQWAARCSAIENVLEVVAGSLLASDPQAEQIIAHLREVMAKPLRIVGHTDAPGRAEQFATDVREFGDHLIDKIERRYQALTAR